MYFPSGRPAFIRWGRVNEEFYELSEKFSEHLLIMKREGCSAVALAKHHYMSQQGISKRIKHAREMEKING